MFVNTHGQPVAAPEAALDVSAKTIHMARAVHALHMKDRGVPVRSIGNYFNVSHATVLKWLKAMPPEVKDAARRRRHMIGL